MRTLTLAKMLGASSTQLRALLNEQAPVQGDRWWFYPSRSGKKSVTLVAHIDTHHDDAREWDYKERRYITKEDKPRLVYFDRDHGVYWSPFGLGADDRAGVWALFQIFRRATDENCPNLLLCDEEESGGGGATSASKEAEKLLKDSTLFFVELDRRGVEDAVFYNGEPKAFQEMIEKFGFKECMGSFSDISILSRELKICGTNLSVGYTMQHTKTEHLYLEVLNNTIRKTLEICASGNAEKKTWSFNPKKWAYSGPTTGFGHWERKRDGHYGNRSGYGYQGSFGDSLDSVERSLGRGAKGRELKIELEDRAWYEYIDRPKADYNTTWEQYKRKRVPELMKEYRKLKSEAKQQDKKDKKDMKALASGKPPKDKENGGKDVRKWGDAEYEVTVCAGCQEGVTVRSTVVKKWTDKIGFYVCVLCRDHFPYIDDPELVKHEYLI